MGTPMPDIQTDWYAYWAAIVDAKHRHHTPEWLSFYARELLLYLPASPGRVLELGCGNGDLYGYLKDRFTSYVGVDFSPAMIRRFRAACPDAGLVVADVADLPLAGARFDAVFSNGVCQYLDEAMLGRSLDHVRRVLQPEGVYLIGNVPDSELRWHCYVGALGADRAVRPAQVIRRLARMAASGRPDELGHWYTRARLCRIARAHGFACRTHSSASYEYRFHALLRPLGEADPAA